MINYEYVNHRFDELSSKLLVQAFREKALTFCVPVNDFYYAVDLFKCLLGADIREEEHKERFDKYRLRLIRLISRFNVYKHTTGKNSSLFENKVYDSKLNSSMLNSYHYLAEAFGDHDILTASPGVLKHSIDVVDRVGFSVVEFAFFLCLFMAVQGRTVEKLNMPITTENERRRARECFRKIKYVLFSSEFEKVLNALLLDYLAEYHQKWYGGRLNRYLTRYWLPKEKQHLKTAHYAVNRYSGKITSTHYSDEDYDALTTSEKYNFLIESDYIKRIQWLFFVLVPLCDAYLDGVLPVDVCELEKMKVKSNQEDSDVVLINVQEFYLASKAVPSCMKEHISNMPPSYYEATIEDFLIAQKLAQAIKGYVDELRKAVVALLETLPEAQIAGEQGLWDLLSQL